MGYKSAMLESSERRVVITQSNYIPWKGYFDQIASSDLFILYEDVQYTKRDWRNRNLIKTPEGLRWLTIPVVTKGRFTQKICETEIADPHWAVKHWKTLRHIYGRLAGADIAIGRPFTKGMPLWRDVARAILIRLSSKLVRQALTLSTFSALKRLARDRYPASPLAGKVYLPVLLSLGVSRTVVNYRRSPRASGRSGYSVMKLVKLAYNRLLLRSSTGYSS